MTVSFIISIIFIICLLVLVAYLGNRIVDLERKQESFYIEGYNRGKADCKTMLLNKIDEV